MTSMLSITTTTTTTTTAITRAVLSTADEEEVGGVGEGKVGGVVGLETVAKDEEWDGSKWTAVENSLDMDYGEGNEGIWVDVGREVVGLETVSKDEEWIAAKNSPSMDDGEGTEGICVGVQRESTHAVVEGCSELGI